MRFIVIGHPRSGKSTVGGLLSSILDTEATDTSAPLVIVESARQDILPMFGGAVQPEEWDNERDRPARPNLIAIGDAMKLLSPTILVDYCFSRGDVCVGVRRHDELVAALEKYPDTILVWVVAADEERNDNFDCKMGLPVDQVVIHNDKAGEDSLRATLEVVVKHYQSKQETGDGAPDLGSGRD